MNAMMAIGAYLSLSGCQTTPNVSQNPENVAVGSGWIGQTFAAGQFSLTGYRPPVFRPGGTLAVYIEGDGVAWKTRTVRSADPTPDDAVALRLALQDPSPNRLYLGRPCQYLSPSALQSCDAKYWTSHRYAPEVVASLDAAVDQAKREAGASEVTLFGYSGGGGLAVLIAAQRRDVRKIVTVAGNLDHAAWTRLHQYDPLDGSKNAVDAAAAVAGIPQVHFIGKEDTVVPPGIVASYLERLNDRSKVAVVEVAGANHKCCWTDPWPLLLRKHVYQAP